MPKLCVHNRTISLDGHALAIYALLKGTKSES